MGGIDSSLPESFDPSGQVSSKPGADHWTLFSLVMKKPEASGFNLVEIAEAGLPELSLKEREGCYRLIAETADGLVEKGLAECSSMTDSAASVEWSLTEDGKNLVVAAEAVKRLRISEPGAP